MRFGKIAITLLVAAALTASASIILRPGWGNPIRALVGLIINLSILLPWCLVLWESFSTAANSSLLPLLPL